MHSGLGRWLSGYVYCLLFQRIWLPFPGSTWTLTTFHNSSSRGFASLQKLVFVACLPIKLSFFYFPGPLLSKMWLRKIVSSPSKCIYASFIYGYVSTSSGYFSLFVLIWSPLLISFISPFNITFKGPFIAVKCLLKCSNTLGHTCHFLSSLLPFFLSSFLVSLLVKWKTMT